MHYELRQIVVSFLGFHFVWGHFDAWKDTKHLNQRPFTEYTFSDSKERGALLRLTSSKNWTAKSYLRPEKLTDGNKKFTSAGFKNRELNYEHAETQLIMTMIIRDENFRDNASPIDVFLFFVMWIHVKRLRQIQIFTEYSSWKIWWN